MANLRDLQGQLQQRYQGAVPTVPTQPAPLSTPLTNPAQRRRSAPPGWAANRQARIDERLKNKADNMPMVPTAEIGKPTAGLPQRPAPTGPMPTFPQQPLPGAGREMGMLPQQPLRPMGPLPAAPLGGANGMMGALPPTALSGSGADADTLLRGLGIYGASGQFYPSAY